MQVLRVEELVVLSPCILIYSYKTISFPLRRQKQSYKLSIFSSAGNNHFRKDIHYEVHRYESSWQTSPLEKKGCQKTSHLHPSEWVMGKKLFQKGGRSVPQNPREMEPAWRTANTSKSCGTTDFTSFAAKQEFHSVGKQTQLIPLFSKPLTQEISQKINKEQKDKGLSFVLREPAPAPASSHREHRPLATWTSQLGNPKNSHCREGWAVTVSHTPVSLQPLKCCLFLNDLQGLTL